MVKSTLEGEAEVGDMEYIEIACSDCDDYKVIAENKGAGSLRGAYWQSYAGRVESFLHKHGSCSVGSVQIVFFNT